MADIDQIKNALTAVKFPGFSRDIVSFGLVREVELEQGVAQIGIEITTGDTKVPETIARAIKSTIGALAGINEVKVRMEISQPKQQPSPAGPGSTNTPTSQQCSDAKGEIRRCHCQR